MKEALGYILGALALAGSWLFTWIKIGNLKAKNKQLEQERDWEKKAKESKIKENKELNEIDKKTDKEIFENWNKSDDQTK